MSDIWESPQGPILWEGSKASVVRGRVWSDELWVEILVGDDRFCVAGPVLMGEGTTKVSEEAGRMVDRARGILESGDDEGANTVGVGK